ncbi:MAG: TAXI family TRAP transporter solute-binding subunit [Pseudomonadales bacterium]
MYRLGSRLLGVVVSLALATGVSAGPEGLPRAMAWSAYNLGTTGYNQAVAIGKVLKDNYNVTLRVLPGKNDVSRLLPLVRGRVQLSANGVATYFAQEGAFQFAHPNWGPLPLRLVMVSNGDSNQALAVAADTGITSFDQLRGRRVPWVRGAPSLNVSTEAFLACGGLAWGDVERVEFSGYGAMWTGIVNGQVDAAYATTVSGPTRKLEASPRGISWPAARHADAACWAGIERVAPYFVKHVATRGAGISATQPHEGATYPYPLLIGLADTDADMVHAVAEVIHHHYDEFKDADPGAIGWAMDRQLFEWVVPYHTGAVRYFRKIGVWTDAYEAHNQRLLERQRVLGDAWRVVKAGSHASDQAFTEAWLAARVRALEAAGFDPIWTDPQSR